MLKTANCVNRISCKFETESNDWHAAIRRTYYITEPYTGCHVHMYVRIHIVELSTVRSTR